MIFIPKYFIYAQRTFYILYAKPNFIQYFFLTVVVEIMHVMLKRLELFYCLLINLKTKEKHSQKQVYLMKNFNLVGTSME